MFDPTGGDARAAKIQTDPLPAPANVAKLVSIYFSAVNIDAPTTVNGSSLRLDGVTVVNQPITAISGTLQLDSLSNNSTISATPTSFFPASIRSSMRSTHCRRTSATSASWADGRSRPPAIYSTPAPFSVDDQSLLTVAGALSLEDTSVLDLTLGAGHGTLIDVQGSASLAGQLQIELANGFVPASGDQFAFMTAGSYVGNFTSFDLPSLPDSETWDTSQAPAGIISNARTVDVGDWRAPLGIAAPSAKTQRIVLITNLSIHGSQMQFRRGGGFSRRRLHMSRVYCGAVNRSERRKKNRLSAKAADCGVRGSSELMQDSEPKVVKVAHPARTP